jgi:hypothetical protein
MGGRAREKERRGREGPRGGKEREKEREEEERQCWTNLSPRSGR